MGRYTDSSSGSISLMPGINECLGESCSLISVMFKRAMQQRHVFPVLNEALKETVGYLVIETS